MVCTPHSVTNSVGAFDDMVVEYRTGLELPCSVCVCRSRGLYGGGRASAARVGRRRAGTLRRGWRAESDAHRQPSDEALQCAMSGLHQ